MSEEKKHEKLNGITPIGVTDWRDTYQAFGIKDKDRLGHIYVIGKTGVGKSTLLQTMAIADIENCHGLAVIDPHGDVAISLLDYVPESRINDVIYFNPGDTEYPIAFNPLHNIDPKQYHLVTAGLISTFKNIWSESWGPRMEYILRFSLLTLLHYPDATLLDIQKLLTDYLFRSNVLAYVTDQSILSFWYNEYDKYTPQLRAESISPVLNKVGIFAASMPLRNSIGQKTSSFNIAHIMDEGRILICNLSKGAIGEDASLLFGSMLVTAVQVAALQRSSQEEQTRKPFYLFIDEVHNYVSLSVITLLSETRKFGLGLFLAHQYIEQLHEKIRAAVFGNVGTMISFRIGAEDAKYLAKEFYPVFSEDDFVNLPRYSMYIKLMIDGTISKPFSAKTIGLKEPTQSHKEAIIFFSRKQYAVKALSIKNTIVKKEIPQQSSLF
jgi:energy-coupling factor transporter ATP-binding protein EcfA2